MDRTEWIAAQTSMNLRDKLDFGEIAVLLLALVAFVVLCVLISRFFSALCEFGFQTLRRFHRAQENAIRTPLPSPFDQCAKQRRWQQIEKARPSYEGSGRVKGA